MLQASAKLSSTNGGKNTVATVAKQGTGPRLHKPVKAVDFLLALPAKKFSSISSNLWTHA